MESWFRPIPAIVQHMTTNKSKVRGSLIAILYATLAAILGTLQHQTQLGDGVPVGLLFSLALVLLAAGAIRDRQPGKLPGLVFTLTLAIEIFVIGQNFSADILIPGNDLGLYWSYGSIAVAALVALWPKLKN